MRLLFGHGDRRFYQRQIIRAVRLGSGTVQRELEQLTNAAIVNRVVEGRQAYYQANPRSPVFNELRGLIRKTFGIAELLAGPLEPFTGRIHAAFIFGSVASGSEHSASDIDVMIIGDNISVLEVVSAFADPQRELQREVNPSIYPVKEFRRKLAKGEHFLSNVVQGEKLFLIGNDDDLARLAE